MSTNSSEIFHGQFELRMSPNKNVLAIVGILWLTFSSGATMNERHKRELKFPKGGSFVAAVALASFLPKGPTDGLAHVLEFDLGFPFPEHFAIEKKNDKKKAWNYLNKPRKNKIRYRSESGKRNKTKRSLKEDQRQNVLLKVQDAISRIGFNGPSCTSRFQCELHSMASKTSLLEEMLFALFKTSEKSDVKECEEHKRGCPVSLLHAVMHSEQISSAHTL